MGNFDSGRTSLLEAYKGFPFTNKITPTPGPNFFWGEILVKNGDKIKYILNDFPGNEAVHSIAFNFVKSSNGAVIVFSVTSKEGFNKAKKWLEEIRNECKIPVIMIACKCDLEENRVISKEEAEQFANENNIPYFETSSKNNINIKEGIDKIINDAYEYERKKLNINNLKNKNKKCYIY